MSKSAKKKIQQKVESLAYFKPKQRKNVCVTLREWAAYIFNCEFEPQTLDESSKDILKSTTLKKRKYEMKIDDLNWAALYKDEAKESKKKMTAIDVKKMNDKDLYLIVCEALKTGGSNTKNNHEKVTNAEAVKSMVEMIERKWNFASNNLKDAMKFLTRTDEESKDDKDDSDAKNNTMHLSGEGSNSDGSISSTDSNSGSSNESNDTDSSESGDESDKDMEDEDVARGDDKELDEEEEEKNTGKNDTVALNDNLDNKGEEKDDDHSNDE